MLTSALTFHANRVWSCVAVLPVIATDDRVEPLVSPLFAVLPDVVAVAPEIDCAPASRVVASSIVTATNTAMEIVPVRRHGSLVIRSLLRGRALVGGRHRDRFGEADVP